MVIRYQCNFNYSQLPVVWGLIVFSLLFSQEKRKYLDIISRYIDIHATIGTTQQKKEKVDISVVPGYVTNHGILNSTALQALLAVRYKKNCFDDIIMM